MPLTAAQIVTLSCQIAKCPGFISQAGQFLNATLQDLCQGYDLDAALGTLAFTFNNGAFSPAVAGSGTGSGPYALPTDYLRTQVKDGKDEFFYTINGVPYPLIQVTKAEYDWLVQTPGYMSYPYDYATDLSASPAQLFVWPPASGSYPAILRYYKLMPDIATPETSNTVPWFLNTEILLTSTAGRLMGLTGDSRYEAYMSEDDQRHPTSWKSKLNVYLKNVEDREGAVHTVGRDRRRWGRNFDQLRNTKTIGWAFAALCVGWLAFASPEPVQACTAPCTKAQITADINANWPDNTTGQITPAVLRSTVLELVNSYVDTNGAASFSCPSSQWITAIATLSSYTCTQPAPADLSGLGAGIATWMGTPSSANLRAALTDETGTGLAYFQGGALGTPSSGDGTNLLNVPIAGGTTGTLPVARGGTGDTGTAWGTYTPSPSCPTSTITTNSARFKTLGKTVFVELDITFSAVTGSTSCTSPNATTAFNLPVTAQSGGALVGQESVSTGRFISCRIAASATQAFCVSAVANAVNDRYVISGVYESQ